MGFEGQQDIEQASYWQLLVQHVVGQHRGGHPGQEGAFGRGHSRVHRRPGIVRVLTLERYQAQHVQEDLRRLGSVFHQVDARQQSQ